MNTAIQPCYEIAAAELAAWVEQQGTDRWWNVDGDPLLTGLLSFPAPGDELADALRRINRPLLVWNKNKNGQAHGQVISRAQLDGLASTVREDIQGAYPSLLDGTEPLWVNNRRLFLRWKGKENEWLMIEDLETMEKTRADVLAQKGG